MTTNETKPETFEYAIEAARYATHGKEAIRTHAVRAWIDRIERAHAADTKRAPSYDALLLIAQSVSGALTRAGVTDCDDPGEAIDVLRERWETAHAADVAMREAVRTMAHALESGEWAEHALCSDSDLVRLEVQISLLIGALHESSNALIESAHAAGAGRVPEGWQLVPRDPTQAMLTVLRFGGNIDNRKTYSAMLSAAPDPKPAPEAEARAVVWQYRMRPTWEGGGSFDEYPWRDCTEAQYEDYKAACALHDWEYQVRALYASPGAQPAPEAEPRVAADLFRWVVAQAEDPNANERFRELRDALSAAHPAPQPPAEPAGETLAEMCAAGRALRGWTLRQAEDETGVSNALISQIETGKQTNPTLRVLSALTRAYRLQPSRVLCAGDTEPAAQPAPSDAQASPQAAQGDVEALAAEVCAAVSADEDGDGCDISAGLIGPNLSAIIRRLASAQPATAKTVGDALLASQLIGIARHIRACDAYAKLRGDADIIERAATRLTGGSHD